MATNTIQQPPTAEQTQQPPTQNAWFNGRAKRNLRENAIAYLFLTPAMLLVLTFGIFPIFYALYVSLFRWRIRQGDYRGLNNYVSAMGDPAYVFFGIIALALLGIAIYTTINTLRTARQKEIPLTYPTLALLPAAIMAIGLVLFILRAVTIFAQGDAAILGNAPLGLLLFILGGAGAWFLNHTQHQRTHKLNSPNFTTPAITILLTAGGATAILWFTINHLQQSEQYAAALIRIQYLVFGLITLAIGYAIWSWSMKQTSTAKWIGGIIGSILILGMGYQLINWWPTIRDGADSDFYLSLAATIFYAIGTVPIQLGISMILAVLLFQNIRAKGLFRIIFFIPYIAPAVATAGIFEAIFSIRETSLANWLFTNGGQNPTAALDWLQEANPAIAELGQALGLNAATAIEWGPSLALAVIILFNIWVFVGYDTVIFLAGLGNIPNTLYEAAKIDGAGRWQLFRHVTLPLLSPTTYFLSVVSVIGTFKAFNHIWVLREPAAQGTVDTASVYFFQMFFRGQRFGYATSMAVVLFVIILTLYLIQNRVAARKVFYG